VLSSNDIAMRTIVDLPDEQIRALDAYGKKHGVSWAEAVRQAVAMFLPKRSQRRLDLSNHPAFGASKHRKADSVRFQRRLREEWGTRP
jgi:metal-responsive CopG/Arc/MetJ family transcriptional regulator